MRIQFVQLTIGKKHSFKLPFFLKALQALGVPEGAGESLEVGEDPAREGWEVAIVYVTVPTRLASFRIQAPKDSGTLERYEWKRGEERTQAKVAGFDLDDEQMSL
eukprot:767690-Hanusia_phi.AAC.1